MKSQLRFASLSLFAILYLAVAAVPAAADNTLYSNGPVNGTGNAWSIGGGTGGGSVVSDSTNLNSSRSNVYGIQFGIWEFPGDTLTSVDWSITCSENGGTVYGSGTASGANLTDTFISSNQYGYNIDLITVSGLDVSLNAGTYWLNLQNAVSAQGNPVFWDENSGPSQASESALGTIPSESFDLYGSTGNGSGTTPEPSTLILFGSGVLGLATATRKRREG